MAAPEYVPKPPTDRARVYESPPWRPDEWFADRPADLTGRQPIGPRLGYPGPDQGYVYVLARQFEGRLVLAPGEHEADAVEGCIAVAMKRASLFGRAPVVHDLTAAFTLWGFLGDADPELVRLRRPLFRECSHGHSYMQKRRIADLVPIAVLRKPHGEIASQARADWRSMFNLRRPDGS
jgi:hypothetical protein